MPLRTKRIAPGISHSCEFAFIPGHGFVPLASGACPVYPEPAEASEAEGW